MVEAKNSRILLAICLLIAVCFFNLPACAKYAGGSGEPNDPYLLYSVEHLNAIGNEPNDWDKHFKLMADIDMGSSAGARFKSIGNSQKRFSGGFDGNGHLIRNLNITGQGHEPVGFFGDVGRGAGIERLGIVDAHVSGTKTVGILVGDNAGMITACFTTGSVTLLPEPQKNPEQIKAEEDEQRKLELEYERIMERVMKEMDVSIPPSYDLPPKLPVWRVGGLVGINYTLIESCYSEAVVHIRIEDSNSIEAGGLIGANMGLIANSYSTGKVPESGGGLLGRNEVGRAERKGIVHLCYWDIEKSGILKSAAGIGKLTSEMKDIDSYRGWDYGQHWTIADEKDYPRLHWEQHAGEPMPMLESLLDGTGRPEDPFVIRTAEQLLLLGGFRSAWDKHLKLGNDIDMSGIDPNDFIAIGMGWLPFTGTFDGDGHSISNFTYKSDIDERAGFFGMVGKRIMGRVLVNGCIKNLILKKAAVCGNSNVGLLVGNNYGVVEGCRVEGTVIGTGSYIGGLVGFSLGHISACSSTGDVRGLDYVGGLVGFANHSRMFIIDNCHSACTVSGRRIVGGMAGKTAGTAIGCSATGDVTGQAYVGGLIGDAGNRTHASFATGNVTGERSVGGLTGSSGRGTSACYATGAVSGKRLVGGLIGLNHGGVIECYATGKTIGKEYVGGLVGTMKLANFPTGTVQQSYWDSQTSGISEGEGGIGKTTAEMQTAATFLDAGWDFVDETANGTDDIWWIDEGQNYPRLWWEADKN